MSGMRLLSTPLAGLTVVETAARQDARGSFVRVFCDQELAALRPGIRFRQVNLSTTRLRGAVRGLHYQTPPHAEAKLIRCLRGAVFDVAVDLRRNSPTFLQWHAVELAEDSPRQVFIPEGFAHGFQALSADVQLLYFHTAAWAPDHEAGLRHDDPRLAIAWPLPTSQISERDSRAPAIDEHFGGLDA